MVHRTLLLKCTKITALCLSLWMLSTVLAQTCPEEHLLPVESEGFASVIGGDMGAARDEAIRDGLRIAVETAVGVFVESNTLVVDSQLVNDEIRTKARGFVQSHKITDEQIDATSVRLTLAACVDQRELKADLESFGAILRDQLGNPRLLILTSGGKSEKIAKASQDILYNHFIGLGFDVRRVNETGCGQDEDEAGVIEVDIILCAVAEATTNSMPFKTPLYSSSVSVKLEAELASTEQIVVNMQSASSPHVSTTSDTAENAALEEALSAVTDQFTNQLVRELNANVERTTSLTVVFRGLPDYSAFSALESYVESIRGVETVGQQRFSYSQGAFSVQGSVLAYEIAQRLANHPKMKLRVTHVDAFSIEMKVDK